MAKAFHRCGYIAVTVCTFAMGGTLICPGLPAPAPSLSSPGDSAKSVVADLTVAWTWTDSLLDNGSFERGLTNGWELGGTSPQGWGLFSYSSGQKFAGTSIYYAAGTAQLIQDFLIPAGATSAQLSWRERLSPVADVPPNDRTRFKVYIAQDPWQILEEVDGAEPVFMNFQWISRSVDVLGFAGYPAQLVVECSRNTVDRGRCSVDVDNFALIASHPHTPEFIVHLGKTSALTSADIVGKTAELSFDLRNLEPLTTYYWKVAAVRDGVTNSSATRSFTTGPSLRPRLFIKDESLDKLTLEFDSLSDRFYAVEQIEAFNGTGEWHSVVAPVPGTGSRMRIQVARPQNDCVFWRLRVNSP